LAPSNLGSVRLRAVLYLKYYLSQFGFEGWFRFWVGDAENQALKLLKLRKQ